MEAKSFCKSGHEKFSAVKIREFVSSKHWDIWSLQYPPYPQPSLSVQPQPIYRCTITRDSPKKYFICKDSHRCENNTRVPCGDTRQHLLHVSTPQVGSGTHAAEREPRQVPPTPRLRSDLLLKSSLPLLHIPRSVLGGLSKLVISCRHQPVAGYQAVS